MNLFKRIVFTLFLAGFSSTAQAGEFHPVVSIGYDVGGDTVFDYTVSTINGRTINRDDKITAGNGLNLAVGAYIPIIDSFGLQATIGLKIDSGSFIDKTYLAFTRNPVDVLGYFHLGEHHNVGIGATYHTGNEFLCTTESTTLTGCNFSFAFDDATGAIAEYNYSVSQNNMGGLKLGLRYTQITYNLSNSTQSFDGSSIGFILYAY